MNTIVLQSIVFICGGAMFLTDCRSESETLDVFFGKNQEDSSWIFLKNPTYFFIVVIRCQQINYQFETRTLFLSKTEQILSLPKGSLIEIKELNVVFTKEKNAEIDWFSKRVKTILKGKEIHHQLYVFEFTDGTFYDELKGKLLDLNLDGYLPIVSFS
jgi:hypothetical protein